MLLLYLLFLLLLLLLLLLVTCQSIQFTPNPRCLSLLLLCHLSFRLSKLNLFLLCSLFLQFLLCFCLLLFCLFSLLFSFFCFNPSRFCIPCLIYQVRKSIPLSFGRLPETRPAIVSLLICTFSSSSSLSCSIILSSS